MAQVGAKLSGRQCGKGLVTSCKINVVRYKLFVSLAYISKVKRIKVHRNKKLSLSANA
jgi:hypothetical protein